MKRKGLIVILVVLAIVCCVAIKTNNVNDYRNNKILQINLDKIYSSVETACEDLADGNKKFETIIDDLVDDCYSSVKTICVLDIDEYNLKEFRWFLLDLRGIDVYTSEQKEQTAETLEAICRAFESTSWSSTKGLGVNGEYDFFSNDYKNVNKVIDEMNKAEVQIESN